MKERKQTQYKKECKTGCFERNTSRNRILNCRVTNAELENIKKQASNVSEFIRQKVLGLEQ